MDLSNIKCYQHKKLNDILRTDISGFDIINHIRIIHEFKPF